MNILLNALLIVHLNGNTTVYQGDITSLNINGSSGGVEMNVDTYSKTTTEDIFGYGMDPGYGTWEIYLHTPEVDEFHTCFASINISDGIVYLDCVK